MEQIHAIGRRKSSVARVFLTKGTGEITVNDRPFEHYFPMPQVQNSVTRPLHVVELLKEFNITVNVDGGGFKGQAEATQLGIARALVKSNADLKPALRANGLMTRNPAEVERKKPGKRKARRSTQFSKR